MRIGLIDADSHNWPNLCLMKLSAYHKARGDLVEWWNPEERYDLVYKSWVFTDTYSKDTITVNNADEVICGGTGYGPDPDLPDVVEHSRPDYGLYPQFPDTAYGFLSRGCPRGCPLSEKWDYLHNPSYRIIRIRSANVCRYSTSNDSNSDY